MNEEKKYHLINAYLKGDLYGSALDEFRLRMKEDPEFAHEVQLQKEISEAISHVREQELRALLRQQAEVKYFNNMWGSKWTYASAAIIILFVSAFFVIKYYAPSQRSEMVTKQVPLSDKNELPESDTTEVDSQTLAIEESKPAIIEMDAIEDHKEEGDSSKLIPMELDLESEIMDDAELEEYRAEEPGKSKEAAELRKEVVKRDELLETKTFFIQVYSQELMDKKISENQNKDTITAGNKYDKDASAKAENDAGTVSSRALVVEFWKSPVNFKGYKYESGKLQLYGIDLGSGIAFKELDGRLYMNVNGVYYFIEKNGKYQKLVQVTNEKLLDILNG